MIKERLFEMFTAGCGATRSSIIEWNREVGVKLLETGRERRIAAPGPQEPSRSPTVPSKPSSFC
jgi:hypothetical protein